MSQFDDLLDTLKIYRRQFAERLDETVAPEDAQRLATTHLAILAVEAVADEKPALKTGPVVSFADDGWPVLAD